MPLDDGAGMFYNRKKAFGGVEMNDLYQRLAPAVQGGGQTGIHPFRPGARRPQA